MHGANKGVNFDSPDTTSNTNFMVTNYTIKKTKVCGIFYNGTGNVTISGSTFVDNNAGICVILNANSNISSVNITQTTIIGRTLADKSQQNRVGIIVYGTDENHAVSVNITGNTIILVSV